MDDSSDEDDDRAASTPGQLVLFLVGTALFVVGVTVVVGLPGTGPISPVESSGTATPSPAMTATPGGDDEQPDERRRDPHGQRVRLGHGESERVVLADTVADAHARGRRRRRPLRRQRHGHADTDAHGECDAEHVTDPERDGDTHVDPGGRRRHLRLR